MSKVARVKGTKPEFNKAVLQKSLLVLRAVKHPQRQKILKIIAAEPEIMVLDIKKKYKIDSTILSQHLAALRKADLVITTKEGRNRRYHLNGNKLEIALNAFGLLA